MIFHSVWAVILHYSFTVLLFNYNNLKAFSQILLLTWFIVGNFQRAVSVVFECCVIAITKHEEFFSVNFVCTENFSPRAMYV